MEPGRIDRDPRKAGAAQHAAHIIRVAERHRSRRMRRLRLGRADMAHRDLERDLPMHIVGDPGPHRHAQPAAGPQRAAEIAECREMVGEEHDPEPRGQQVEARRREGVGLRIRQQRCQVGDALLSHAPAQ